MEYGTVVTRDGLSVTNCNTKTQSVFQLVPTSLILMGNCYFYGLCLLSYGELLY